MVLYGCIVFVLFSCVPRPSFAEDREEEIQAQIRGLKSRDRKVRQAAAKVLAELGKEALPALPALSEALKDRDEVVSYRAAKALSNLGAPAVSHLAVALADGRTAVRKNAADALKTIALKGGDCSIAIPSLIDSLGDESARVETRSAAALVAMGEAAVPALIDALADGNASIRRRSAATLGRIGPAAAAAAPDLAEGLKDDDAGVRAACARSLGKIGPEARSAIPALVEALGDRDVELRCRSVEVLGAIAVNKDGRDALPPLVNSLGDKSQRVRSRASDSLVEAGETAVPALVDAMGSENRRIRLTAAATLGKIGPAAGVAVPCLGEGLNDGDGDVRRACAVALRKIGPEAREAVPFLIKALGDDDVEIRCEVVDALSVMPALEPGLVEAIIMSMADESDRVVSRAGKAVASWGDASVPQLAVALSNDDYRVSIGSARALQKIKGGSAEAVPALVEAFNSGIPEIRETAIVALGRIGPEAMGSLPALKDIESTDKSSAIRRLAREAIDRIEPQK